MLQALPNRLGIPETEKTMGFYRCFDEGMPTRAGWDVAKYDGWRMALIIKDFVENQDLTVEWTRVQMRRAMLVSYEANCLIKRERFSL